MLSLKNLDKINYLRYNVNNKISRLKRRLGLDEVEITKNGNGLITAYYNGIEIDFAREKGEIIGKDRRSFTGGRAYFPPSDYARVMEAVCDFWGLPYSPRLFTFVGIKKRQKQNREALLAEGAQTKMF